ncbi:MAG: hypothetical protein H6Q17_974 [Bacteroidetes bacterium]|nr:hypothetical protein [Bacteroidota bacterium]
MGTLIANEPDYVFILLMFCSRHRVCTINRPFNPSLSKSVSLRLTESLTCNGENLPSRELFFIGVSYFDYT